jgi:hypothetical protein
VYAPDRPCAVLPALRPHLSPHRSRDTVTYRKVGVHGIRIFYREAGPNDAPMILLLHGFPFPNVSHMFRDLIPQLADRIRLVAPDLRRLGSPTCRRAAPSPTRPRMPQTSSIASPTWISLRRLAIYVVDYDLPLGFCSKNTKRLRRENRFAIRATFHQHV